MLHGAAVMTVLMFGAGALAGSLVGKVAGNALLDHLAIRRQRRLANEQRQMQARDEVELLARSVQKPFTQASVAFSVRGDSVDVGAVRLRRRDLQAGVPLAQDEEA